MFTNNMSNRNISQNTLLFWLRRISLALAMTYAGTRGETESQMAQVMYFLPQAQFHLTNTQFSH